MMLADTEWWGRRAAQAAPGGNMHRESVRSNQRPGLGPMRYRLAIVQSHPIQYFSPLYSYLMDCSGVDVTVLYCSNSSSRGEIDNGFEQSVTWDIDLFHGYNSVLMGGMKATLRQPQGFLSLFAPEVFSEIRRGRYDALLVYGYHYAAYVLAAAAARALGVPVLMRMETHLGLLRSVLRKRTRDLVLSTVFSMLQGFLAIGTANREYYRSLAVPDDKVFLMPYAVDNARFGQPSLHSRESVARVRAHLGLSMDQPVVLCVTKFTPRKSADDLLRAVGVLQRDRRVECSLLFVGSGPLEGALRRQAADLGVKNVVWAGFVNQSRLPALYAASDVFVLPSIGEPWGLVVNEAMAAGLPVVVRHGIGCAPDLVREGVNGYTFGGPEQPDLVDALYPLLVDHGLRVQMATASDAIIRSWGFREAAQGLMMALERVSRR